MSPDLLHLQLPGNDGAHTSRLGLGMASLMREGSRRRRSAVFDSAFQAGFRHFDVAPLYGLGRAEHDLGRHLRRNGIVDATVSTKFGLRPSPAAQFIAPLQAPGRAMLDRWPSLKHVARTSFGSVRAATTPNLADLEESLGRSLDALGVNEISVLLLHDLLWSPRMHSLLEEIRGAGGIRKAKLLGVTGDRAILNAYPKEVLQDFAVLQMPFGQDPASRRAPDQLLVQYGLLAKNLALVDRFLGSEVAARRRIEELVGSGLHGLPSVAALLVGLALASNTNTIVLVGTTSPHHAQFMWQWIADSQSYLIHNHDRILSLLPIEH